MDVVRMPYLVEEVAAELDMNKRHVKIVLDTFFTIIADELAEGNEVAVSPYVQFRYRISPAVKKGTMVWNPGTGERQPSAGRPAKISIRATALSGLKKNVPVAGTKAGKAILRERQAAKAAKA